jgi:hypothetical protein
MKRVVLVVALAALSLIAFAGPVAAHGLPLPGYGGLPDAACNQGTEQAFFDIGASFAVPMDGTDFNEPWCMTMMVTLNASQSRPSQ